MAAHRMLHVFGIVRSVAAGAASCPNDEPKTGAVGYKTIQFLTFRSRRPML